jgi:hypothetical protein
MDDNDDGRDDTLVTLVDFGEIAPDYEGDIVACGRLLLWCEEHLVWKDIERNRIKEAARLLQHGDTALALRKFQAVAHCSNN